MGFRFPGHRPWFLFWFAPVVLSGSMRWLLRTWWEPLLMTVTVLAATRISTEVWASVMPVPSAMSCSRSRCVGGTVRKPARPSSTARWLGKGTPTMSYVASKIAVTRTMTQATCLS